jgi:dTDP-4-dehydrorhamnose reductase
MAADDSLAGAAPEVWAGIECTVNRVGDRTFDQVAWSGHDRRIGDLDRLAALGVAAVRYPLLWERVVAGAEGPDWEWSRTRLDRLAALGVRPIATLLHHGSGPRSTSLVDPGFPEKLAQFAQAAAEQHPWVLEWTPVNEPLTTARFSALYGHWYPHARDVRLFVRAVLNQCRGIGLAMAQIRRINPRARLVHTEDCGRTQATAHLQYQADYENERRLLGLDLLCGRVQPQHPLWPHLLACGVTEAELSWFAEHPCPPDVVGMNYYVTSDRFLDHRLENYPAACQGGNGHDRYADVEAVRVAGVQIAGHASIIDELWQRYRRPIAVTEVHLGCTREQQLRWLAEAWQAALDRRDAGCDVRAVTAWAALGTHSWDRLVTSDDGSYEPGLFDVRSRPPRPTALATAVGALAQGREIDHPTAAGSGWWRSPARVLYPAGVRLPHPSTEGAPVLVLGAGTLGRALARAAGGRGLSCLLAGRREVDLTDGQAVGALLDSQRPWAVINAAGYVNVDRAEHEPERCWRDNVLGPITVATECRRRNLRFITISSDLVFDGRHDRPYLESDSPAPICVYGSSKAEAEARVRELDDTALIVRTAAFFDPWEDRNFVAGALEALGQPRALRAAGDLVVSPTYVPELADALLDLAIDGERGIWHLCNEGALSWAALARWAAVAAGLDPALVHAVPAAELELVAPRPAFSALASERGAFLRPLGQALDAFVTERRKLERAA